MTKGDGPWIARSRLRDDLRGVPSVRPAGRVAARALDGGLAWAYPTLVG